MRFSLVRWLCRLSGEDCQLIQHSKTDPKVKLRFAFIGILVLAIFLISSYSSTHFIYHLFNENIYLAIPIGAVWGLMMVNIYLLLLSTITPAMLKGGERAHKGVKQKQPGNYKWLNIISLSFRIGFVLLIAVMIAQPWLVATFTPSVTDQLGRYTQEYRNEFVIQADSLLILQEAKLEKDMQQQMTLVAKDPADTSVMANFGRSVNDKINEDQFFLTNASSIRMRMAQIKAHRIPGQAKQITTLEDKLTTLVTHEMTTDSLFVLQSGPAPVADAPVIKIIREAEFKLVSIIDAKNGQYKKLNSLLTANNFYVRKIQLINSQIPLSWLITVLLVLIFIMPILLKYRIRNKSNFYTEKKELEMNIVLEEYVSFGKEYSAIFESRFGLQAVFYESCSDPPFNTHRKEQNKQYEDQAILLDAIYGNQQDADENKYLVSETIS